MQLLRVEPQVRFLYAELINSPHPSDRKFLKVNEDLAIHLLNIYADDLLSFLYDEETENVNLMENKRIEHELKISYWDKFGENDPNKVPETIEEVLVDERSWNDPEIYQWLLFYDTNPVPFYIKLAVLIRKAWENAHIDPKEAVKVNENENGKKSYEINYDMLTEYLMKKFAPVSFRKMTYIFDGRRYVEDEKRIASEGEKILREGGLTEKRKIKDIMTDILYRVDIRSQIHTSEFPFNRLKGKLIPCKNGVLWREEVYHLLPHSPLFGFSYSLNVNYNPSARAEKINEFIRSLVSKEDLPILYEIPALAILQDPWIQKAYMIVGSGSNGKSTYLSLVTELLGKENVSNVPLQDLTDHGDKFAKAELVGKLANIYADLPDRALRNPGAFKVLTGGDRTTAQKKFKDPFSFQNTALLIFSANKTPEVTDDTYAFWRRWVIIEFPYTFKENKDFLRSLLTEEELSGFFNEVLKAMHRIETEGKVTVTKTAEERRDEWRKRSNSIYAFVNDMCERDDSHVITKEELYRRYVEYCEEEGLNARSKVEFGRELPRFAPYVLSDMRRVGGEVKRVWVGIRVKELNNEENELQEVSGFWGTCSYCGEYALIKFKDRDGYYLCEKCAENRGGES